MSRRIQWEGESCKQDECLRPRQVIGGPQRPVAELVEAEACSPAASPAAVRTVQACIHGCSFCATARRDCDSFASFVRIMRCSNRL